MKNESQDKEKDVKEFTSKNTPKVLSKLLRIHKVFPNDNHIKGLIGEIEACKILTKLLPKNYKVYHYSANKSGYDLAISNTINKKSTRINVKTSYRFNAKTTEDKVYHWQCPTIRLTNKSAEFDFIFLDPPYDTGLGEKTMRALAQSAIIKKDSLIILECRDSDELPASQKCFHCLKDKFYGDTRVVIYRCVQGTG